MANNSWNETNTFWGLASSSLAFFSLGVGSAMTDRVKIGHAFFVIAALFGVGAVVFVRSGRSKTWISVLTSVLVILSILCVDYVVQPTSVSVEVEHARIDVFSIKLLTETPMALFKDTPVFNVGYSNRGKIPARGVSPKATMIVLSAPLTESEIAKGQRENSTFDLVMLDKVNSDQAQMYPVAES